MPSAPRERTGAIGDVTRRRALALLAGTLAAGSGTGADAVGSGRRVTPRFRVRTLTAGVPLERLDTPGPVAGALEFLASARRRVVEAGYEVQTIRVTLNPLLRDATRAQRTAALPALHELDQLAADHGAMLGIGPVFGRGAWDPSIAPWAVELVAATRVTCFSVEVAGENDGPRDGAARVAGAVIAALAAATADGSANFRFAAAASIPPGTPFFPVGYHDGEPSLAIGLESAGLVGEAFAGAADHVQATARLQMIMNGALRPVEDLGRLIATAAGRRYLGIDASPAPGVDCSIVRALEALAQQPFGAPSTLQSCSAVTAALRALEVSTCGYSGLMLPVLEDPVLAARAAEGRVTLSQLLLCSSVCGTGLDLVPLPGSVTATELARIVGDVATLATRLRKPLSARLMPVIGKRAGDEVRLDDPRLCAARVLPPGG